MTTRVSRAKRLLAALDTIQGALEEIEELKSELEDWRTNLEGTNLENTHKFEQLGEAIDQLEEGHGEIANGVSSLENVEFPTMFS